MVQDKTQTAENGLVGPLATMNNKKNLVLLLCVSALSISALAQTSRPGNPRGYSPDALLEVFKLTQADSDVPFDSLLQACKARDCIPSIDQPVFIKAGSVDYLRDDDLLLALTYNGLTRAYPIRILDHHEIVNDMFGSDPVVITYCPLCGSGLAFESLKLATRPWPLMVNGWPSKGSGQTRLTAGT